MSKFFSLLSKVVAFLAVSSLSTCTKDNDELQSKIDLLDAEDYFPLQINNYWQLSGFPVRSVAELKTIDNVAYYAMVSGADTTYYRETADGKVYQRTKATAEILRFDLGADEGETWTYPDKDAHYVWNAVLSSKNETVIVGGRSFENCYRFSFDIPQMADDEHLVLLAPGIGFIEEYYSGGSGQTLLTEATIDGVEIHF
jgi:hypothetical protein